MNRRQFLRTAALATVAVPALALGAKHTVEASSVHEEKGFIIVSCAEADCKGCNWVHRQRIVYPVSLHNQAHNSIGGNRPHRVVIEWSDGWETWHGGYAMYDDSWIREQLGVEINDRPYVYESRNPVYSVKDVEHFWWSADAIAWSRVNWRDRFNMKTQAYVHDDPEVFGRQLVRHPEAKVKA